MRAVFNNPKVKVNQAINNPLELGKDPKYISTVPSLEVAIAGAQVLASNGSSYVIQGNGIDATRGYHVYWAYDPIKSNMELAKAFEACGNNIVDFTRNLSKMGGEIGQLMQKAWKHGVVFATAVALALFEVGKRATEGGSLVKDEGKNNSSSST